MAPSKLPVADRPMARMMWAFTTWSWSVAIGGEEGRAGVEHLLDGALAGSKQASLLVFEPACGPEEACYQQGARRGAGA